MCTQLFYHVLYLCQQGPLSYSNVNSSSYNLLTAWMVAGLLLPNTGSWTAMSSDGDGCFLDFGAKGSDNDLEQPLSNEELEDHSPSLYKMMLRYQDSQREAEKRELRELWFSGKAIHDCPSESDGLEQDSIDIDHEAALKVDVKKYICKFNAVSQNLPAVMHIQKQHKRKCQSKNL